MRVIKKGGHNEMCAGYSYDYSVFLDDYDNVACAITEIEEWVKENPQDGSWGIYINDAIVTSSWQEPDWKKKYEGDFTEKVISIRGTGGWYCGINFYITAEKIPNFIEKKYSDMTPEELEIISSFKF